MSDPLVALDAAIEEASPTERAALVVQIAARLARLGAGLADPPPNAVVGTDPDHSVDVKEAATRLGVSDRYLYRHWGEYAFARKEGGKLVFSAHGLERHIARARRQR